MISQMLYSSENTGQELKLSPLTTCLFEVYLFSEKQEHCKDAVDAGDLVRNCSYAFREQW